MNDATPASFWERLAAHVIEHVMYWLVFWVSMLTAAQADSISLLISRLIQQIAIVWLPLTLGIHIMELAFLRQYGASVGKLVTGLELRSATGKIFNVKMILFREYIAKRVSAVFLMAGYWWMLRDSDKRAWHDMFVGSRVIQTGNRSALGGVVAIAMLFVCGYVVSRVFGILASNQALIEQFIFVFEPVSGFTLPW